MKSGTEVKRLERMLAEQIRLLATTASENHAPPTPEELAETERLSKLVDMARTIHKNPLQTKAFGLCAAFALIALVCLAASIPYEPTTVSLKASSTDVVFWTRYQEVYSNVNLESLAFEGAHFEWQSPDGKFHEEDGEAKIAGGMIKPFAYTGLAEGLVALHYDARRDRFKITLDTPKGDVPFIVELGNDSSLTVNGTAASLIEADRRLIVSPSTTAHDGIAEDPDTGFVTGKIVAWLKTINRTTNLLRAEKAKYLRFVEPAHYNGASDYSWFYGSRLIDGTASFADLPGLSHSFDRYDDVTINDEDGLLQSLDLDSGKILINYTSQTSSITVGENEKASSLIPSYLDYLRTRPYINSIYSIAASLIAMVFAAMTWLGRKSE